MNGDFEKNNQNRTDWSNLSTQYDDDTIEVRLTWEKGAMIEEKNS